jgi:hypothetical protein
MSNGMLKQTVCDCGWRARGTDWWPELHYA